MAKNNNLVTIGKTIIALTGATKEFMVSRRTAKEILVEIQRVFPGCETSEKSIYSTVCKANISMPGAIRTQPIDVEAYEELMARLELERAPQAKTGTSDKK